MKEQGSSRKQAESAAAAPPVRGATDVAALDPALQHLVRAMLVEGATFEDVMEAVNERPGPGITLGAIKHYFRSNLSVQQERVRRQVEAAQALKAALGDPNRAEAQLAEAVLLSGWQAVNRQGALLTLKDVARQRLQNENLRLRQRMLRHREKELRDRQRLIEKRLEAELVRVQLLRQKMGKVDQAVRDEHGRIRITDEAYRQIQEVYGLLDSQNDGPRTPKAGE